MRSNILLRLSLLSLALLINGAFAQAYDSTMPSNGRFEILTAPAAATMRLDRFTGALWELKRIGNDKQVWSPIANGKGPGKSYTHASYQLMVRTEHVANIEVTDRVVQDSESGQSWELVYSNDALAYRPISVSSEKSKEKEE